MLLVCECFTLFIYTECEPTAIRFLKEDVDFNVNDSHFQLEFIKPLVIIGLINYEEHLQPIIRDSDKKVCNKVAFFWLS